MTGAHARPGDQAGARAAAVDALDRALVIATQGGLPLVPRPYQALAAELGCSEAEVIERLGRMLEQGLIRRIGVVPNHYAIGYTANGMSVWDIDDALVDAVGQRVGGLDFVTHCYRRPRHLPDWPYNLFAMVHADSREGAKARVAEIAALIASEFPRACKSHDVLFSSGILKKTGLRIGG